ncbi:hypothetical protein QCB44_08120 [Thiomicrorhabdus sp. zzn3]|uniref:hypothetical protein n=1 Tax=Thiomicrorhabdus sp. zzn3 TaxID=3039775 RepID=UPI00243721CA|nr:hypothetical protein [Thiomicrorhabdus sp. zzn3]MDG6778667.1 hypothetical protein [Thiomicrorhabdus sp. zzn3]
MRSFLRRTITPLSLLNVIFLAGCLGITQPTEEMVENGVTQHFNQQYAGLFTVLSANKENGYKQNDTHYVAEMRVIARADRSLAEYSEQLLKDPSLNPFEKMAHGMNLTLLKMTLPEFEVGDQLEFKRNYLFIKTDNGWLLKKELTENDLSETL